MKVYSPLIAVAIVVATFAPRIEATCTPVCDPNASGAATAGCFALAAPLTSDATPPFTKPGELTCTKGAYLASLKYSWDNSGTNAAPTGAFTDTAPTPAPVPATVTPIPNNDCGKSYTDVGKGGTATSSTVQAKFTCGTTACGAITYQTTWTCNCAAPCTVGGSGVANALCADTTSAVTASTTFSIPDQTTSTCPQGAYLASLTYQWAGANEPTLTFVDGTGSTLPAASVTTPTITTSCSKTYTNVGKIAGLTSNVKAAFNCAAGNTCGVVTYQPTWACNCAAACTSSDAGCVTSKQVVDGTPFVLSGPTDNTCGDNGQYLASLKFSSGVSDNIGVTFQTVPLGGSPSTLQDPGATPITSCSKSWTDVGKSPSQTSSVQATFTCTGTACNIAYQATWKCNPPPPCTSSARICTTTGTPQNCVAAKNINAGESWTLTLDPADTNTCPSGKKYFTFLDYSWGVNDNVAVTFSDTTTPAAVPIGPAPAGITKSACSQRFTDAGKGVTTGVQATFTCNNPSTACTVDYMPTSACNTVPLASTCTSVLCATTTTTGCIVSQVPPATPLVLTAPANPVCTFLGQYLTSFQLSPSTTGSADVFSVAFTDSATTPATIPVTTTSPNLCTKSYGDVGKGRATSTQATITCTTGSGTPAVCNVAYKAKWGCQPAPACGSVCTGTDNGCVPTKSITAGTATAFKVTPPANSNCPNGQYLLAFKYSAASTDSLDVTFKDMTTAANPLLPQPTALTVNQCAKGFTDVGRGSFNGVQAVLTCNNQAVNGVTSPCTVSYQATWACNPLPTCTALCTSTTAGACTFNAGVANGDAAAISITAPAPAPAPCTTGQYLSSLKVSYASGDSVGVTFMDSAATPVPVPAAATSISGCAKMYTNVGKNFEATNPVKAKITCTKGTGQTCNVAYQPTWTCNDAVGACAPVCANTTTGCVSASIPNDKPLKLTVPTGCATDITQYLASLKVSGASGDTYSVAFSDPAVPATVYTATATVVNACAKSYTNVGKDATTSVTATITCANTAVAPATIPSPCTITYIPTWVCRNPALPTDSCNKICATTDGCTESTIPSTLTLSLNTTNNVNQCPGKSYLQSLKVGSIAKHAIDASFAGFTGAASVNLASAPVKEGTCYSEYTQTPSDLSTLTANETATVTCSETAKSCVAQTMPVWGCLAGNCPTPCMNCKDAYISVGGNFLIQKPSPTTCPAGSFAYPKNIVVAGKYAAYKVSASVNPVVTLTPDVRDSGCYFSYTNPFGSTALTFDATVTVSCTDAKSACTAQYKADWDCYTPLQNLTQTYRRTKTTGAGCVTTASDCLNRCAKSYALGNVAATPTTRTLVPQAVGSECVCQYLTAPQTGNDPKTLANAATTLSVTLTDPAANMTVLTTTPDCTSTYVLGNFTNLFVNTTYTRQNTSGDCPSDSCEIKCSAELIITKQIDTIVAVQSGANVGTCKCTNTTAYVSDDGKSATGTTVTAASGTATNTVTYLFNATGTPTLAGITLATTMPATPAARRLQQSTPAATTKTCTAFYVDKNPPTPAPTTPKPTTQSPPPTAAPPAPTTATTSKSAGVSARQGGDDVVTVTLLATAAGAVAAGGAGHVEL